MVALTKLAAFSRPTVLGVTFEMTSYEQDDGAVLFALKRGDVGHEGVLVRIQSACLFGESFGVNSCDCAEQLQMALRMGAAGEPLLLVYLPHQEGRGHGMVRKIQAIELEANEGLEMPDAFRRLGWEFDVREYAGAAAVIRDLVGDRGVTLLTNNPKKVDGLRQHGVRVIERRPLVVPNPTSECRRYLNSKRREMGHILPDL